MDAMMSLGFSLLAGVYVGVCVRARQWPGALLAFLLLGLGWQIGF